MLQRYSSPEKNTLTPTVSKACSFYIQTLTCLIIWKHTRGRHSLPCASPHSTQHLALSGSLLVLRAWGNGSGRQSPPGGHLPLLLYLGCTGSHHTCLTDSTCQGNHASGKAALSFGVQEAAANWKEWSLHPPRCQETLPTHQHQLPTWLSFNF